MSRRVSVSQVLALQFGGAFLVLACFRILVPTTRAPTSTGRRGRLALIGAVGLPGTMVLQCPAFAVAPLVAANAIAYAWPLMAAAWTALAPGKRGSRASLVLAVVGFGGVILPFASRQDGGQAGSASVIGYIAALGSAVAMAGYTLTAGRSGARTNDLLLLGTGAGAGAIGRIPHRASAGRCVVAGVGGGAGARNRRGDDGHRLRAVDVRDGSPGRRPAGPRRLRHAAAVHGGPARYRSAALAARTARLRAHRPLRSRRDPRRAPPPPPPNAPRHDQPTITERRRQVRRVHRSL